MLTLSATRRVADSTRLLDAGRDAEDRPPPNPAIDAAAVVSDQEPLVLAGTLTTVLNLTVPLLICHLSLGRARRRASALPKLAPNLADH